MGLSLALALAACGGTTTASTAQDATSMQASKLALGILKLETTDQAVSNDLAKELLPLWQLLAELDANGGAAPQETTAVIEEIQAAMTAGQLSAIDEMQLSVPGLAEDSTSASTTETASGAIQGGAPMIQGMPPDGGAGMPPGIEAPPGGSGARQSSTDAASASTGSETDGSLSLVRQVISLLESKAER